MSYIEKETKVFVPILLLMNISVFFTASVFHFVVYSIISLSTIIYIIVRDLKFSDKDYKHNLSIVLVIYYTILTLTGGPFVSVSSVITIFTSLAWIPVLIILIYIALHFLGGYRTTSTDITTYKNDERGNDAIQTTAHTYTNQGSGRGGTNWMARSNMQEDTKIKK